MKRALILVALLAFAQFALAGGILTNTNQSAQFVRTLSRNASTDLDATYFNPAGLTQVEDGFHISISNQYITQEKKIENDFAMLNNSEFIGDVKAPLFPDFYAVYKKDKMAFSFGFGPNAGGGSAEYKNGLPGFEMLASMIVPTLQVSLAMIDLGIEAATGQNPGFSNVTGYDMDMYLNGSSVYYGFQANAAYQLNDMISVAVGGRYISAVNTYEGHLKDVTITAPAAYGGAQAPGDYLRLIASQVEAMDPATAMLLSGTAAVLDEETGDKELDAKQTASGITPIFCVNLALTEALNIGIKYEMETPLELVNETTKDVMEMFPDGEKYQANIPAILSTGISYDLTEAFNAAFSFTYYFDKETDNEGWKDEETGESLIESNTYEIGVGLQYAISEQLAVSAGYQLTAISVADEYQSEMEHELSANTVGGGIRYKLNESIDLDLGALYAMYSEASVEIPQMYTETYNRSSLAIVAGLGYHF